MPYLFLLFIAMPIAEIAVLIQVGSAIGAWTTIAIVILTAIIGTFMLRQQGMATLAKAQHRMQAGEMPAQQLLEGLLLLIGGVLLLTPGFITDFFGFCTLIPWSREFLAKQLAKRWMSGASILVGGRGFSTGGPGRFDQEHDNSAAYRQNTAQQPGPNSSSSTASTSRKGGGDVIDGDYERLD